MRVRSASDRLEKLVDEIRACRFCVAQPEGSRLPHEPRPVLRVSTTARLLVAGQAPGNLVHQTGLPFNDPSGNRLRDWMGVDRDAFYDVSRIAVVPMGFCFPGYDATGSDLSPRRECRKIWHDALFAALPQIETVLAIGRYAQDYHLARIGQAPPRTATVSQTVGRWREFLNARPKVFALPHPSWRNTGWLKRHPWFEAELLPELRDEVARLTQGAPAASSSNSRRVGRTMLQNAK
jgi:uracil-DNA glycosylase